MMVYHSNNNIDNSSNSNSSNSNSRTHNNQRNPSLILMQIL